MNDKQYRTLIGGVAFRTKRIFDKELYEAADAMADDPEVIEYLKSYSTPGSKNHRRRRDYLIDEMLNAIEML